MKKRGGNRKERDRKLATNLLLFHEQRVWAIIDDTLTEHWGCEMCIGLFSTNI